MVALWVVIGLIISTIAVSTLGASFSVLGLGALFSGAVIAVVVMAASLELSKFVLAAYLHQRWKKLNFVFKYYLVFAVVTLSVITSMGIFGFLSNAYQSASSVLEGETIKLESLKEQQSRHATDIARLNKTIDEIPANQTTKRFKARAELEPQIKALSDQTQAVAQEITAANLKLLDVKQKVGPLIYISRSFNIDIDTVVKYLILLLVCVFDPLAICLVVATSEALTARREEKSQPVKATAAAPVHPDIIAPAMTATAPPEPSPAPPEPVAPDHPSEEIIQMRFTDANDKNVG